MKKLTKTLVILAISLTLAACGSGSKVLDDKEVTVGVTGGPHEQIMKEVAKVAKKDGVTIKLKVFSDYNTPNTTLDQGELDANSFQTLPFLKNQIKSKDFKITEVFATVAFPLGIYSDSIKSIDDIKEGDKIAVPNDPANELRALQLFEEAGLIKLSDQAGENTTKKDIVENKLNLEIVELDSAQVSKHLGEVKAAAINTNFAMGAGLNIKDDAIYHEPLTDNPYPNYFAVRIENKDDAIVNKLKKYYHSDEVKAYIAKQFKGSVVTTW